MKKISLQLLILSIIFAALPSLTFAQRNVDLEKKWSRVTIDRNSTNTNLDYKYIPGPPVYRTYDLGSIDAFVMPNYRVLPTTNTTQSELSIDIHPLNPSIIFASANATPWPVSGIYGTGVYWTTNAGTNWVGFDNPPFGGNNGDPASAIGTNGYFYEGYISASGGMGVATSTNSGANWTTSIASSATSDDKNHLTVDKTVGSPFENRVYNTWTDFNVGANENDAVLKFSTNFGTSWSSLINLSSTLNAGSHSQGVNVQTGPNGEAYVAFAVYDNFPSGEDAIGFSKSTDGGATWNSSRIYGAMTPNGSFNFGIRGYLKPTDIRVASFPSMAVDRSGGVNAGTIYIVWPQINVAPAGSDPDVVLIKSVDNGVTWSAPVRVNDDALNNGKEQYYPWCTVDQNTGRLSIVFYDNRNTTSDSTGVFLATSIDGGNTFENFEVSDANFRPKPISGLAGGYQGDYIGIAAAGNKAYPFWMDDRTGNYQAWITEVTFGPGISHTPLSDTEDLSGPYVVNATITSQNPLIQSEIKMFWGIGAGVISDSVVMTNIGGNDYTASIAGDGSSHIYNYYIKALDDQGFVGTSPGGAPANYHSFEAATDVVPPTIVHTPLNSQALIRWPVSLNANASDIFGIQSVECEFMVNGGTVTTFPMNLVSGTQYSGTFTNIPVQVGDVVEYRIKAIDNSSQNNIAYSPSSGYNSFEIINTKGIVLVVDDDITLANRLSSDKGFQQDVEKLAPLGASASLFNTTLTDRGYLVDEVTFGNLDVSILPNYDIVILAAGVNTSTQFNDATKRTALVNYVLNGGKTLTEGGEVGYVYQAGASEVDALFRRNILNDSDWVSDVTSSNLVVSTPTHPIFNTPNSLTGPFNITATGFGPRDEMTILPGKIGVTRIANWSSGSPSNPGIIVYNPGADPNSCDNIFFTFAISQFTDQTAAANLIENAVDYLMQDILPVRIIHTPLTNTTNLDGPYVVNAEVTALNTLDPSSVKVYWGSGVGSITDSILMINSSGDTFTASIPGNGAINTYNYYIKAADNLGNTASAPIGAPGDYYSFEAVVDIDAPIITHNPLSDQALGRWPVDISAAVFDEFGVQSVQCEFNVNSGSATTFAMPLVGGTNYRGTFTSVSVQVGDLIQYKIIAADNAGNIAYSPTSDYNSFNIIDVKGNILVVDDDVTFEQRISADKNSDPDMLTPLGASASIFSSALLNAGYSVDEVTFSNLDVLTLSNYDIVILSAGIKETTQFNDAAKRNALVSFTLNGGRVIVEGGEVGYLYRKSGTTTDLDPTFRRNILNDSSWVDDRTNNDLVISTPDHPIFTTPNSITGPIAVTNSAGTGYGARDEVTLLPGKVGVSRIASWSAGSATNGGLIIYNPNGDPDNCRNIFYTFAISQITDPVVAAHLIENTAEYMMSGAIPVELTSFDANVTDAAVNLKWITATELNNSGFEIERKSSENQFVQIGFVPGSGTSTEARTYSFSDTKVTSGNYTYRLKQVDFDGSFEYSNEVNVDINIPDVYSLSQNYPNPFNPSTLIKYSVAKDGYVNVSIFNLLGEKVATLVNSNMKAGSYELNFNASRLSSGVYFYSIEAGDFKAVKKMMLMK